MSVNWSLKYELRAWQHAALAEWSKNSRRGIVEVVTGGGKTVFAEACLLDALGAFPTIRALIVMPTVALLDQWYVVLQEELSVDSADLAVHAGAKRPKPARINLAVINTARRIGSELAKNGDWMLVVDECHRSGSPKNVLALRGSYRATLGLSATPERQYDDALDTAVVPALGPILYRYDITQARRDGIVTPFVLRNVQVDLLADEEKEYKRLSRRIAAKLHGRPEPTEPRDIPDDVAALFRARARVVSLASMRVPVAVRIADRHRGQRLMIFHESKAAASKIAELLRARGHSSTTYHTGIGPIIRRSNLRLYRQGVYDAIVSCRALDEGINVPETEVAIIASATATTRQRVQRLGRVLRPSPGKQHAVIYTLYATDAERRRLEGEEHHLDEVASVQWIRATRGVSA